MDYEGIYRKTGGTSQIKQITQLFDASDAVSFEEDSWDITAITSVLKNFFRALENPLYPYELYNELVSAAGECFAYQKKLDCTS